METQIDNILTVSEAATFLGLKKGTIYEATSAKKIPYYKSETTKRIYFKREELESWKQDKKNKEFKALKKFQVLENTNN